MANTKKQNITITAAFSFIALTGAAILGWERIDSVLHDDLAQAAELKSVDRKVKFNTVFAGENRYNILNIMLDRKRELLAKINLAASQNGMSPALQASKRDIESSIRQIELDVVRLVDNKYEKSDW
jgi:hypothetical protein